MKRLANKSALPLAIRRDFTVLERGRYWHIRCDVCRKAWSLPREKQTHPGNILHLLNHAEGHKQGAVDPDSQDNFPRDDADLAP
jgi:hypothetical protein